MKHKIINTVGFLTLLSALLMIAYVAYYSLYPFKVIDIQNQPYPVLTPQVKQGDNMIFYAEYCKYMNIPSETTTSFVDTLIFNEAGRKSSGSDIGCYKREILVEIPEKLPAGIYRYRIVTDHKVHPVLRIIRVIAETEEFEVTE